MAAHEDTPHIRTRLINPVGGVARLQRWTVNTVSGAESLAYDSGEVEYKWAGSQYTESVGHPFLSSKQKGKADLGGEFYTSKIEKGGSNGIVSIRYLYSSSPSSAIRTKYDGPLLAVNPASSSVRGDWPSESTDTELEALGATAIARVSPTNPVVDLTTAIAEIRKGGLPHLPAINTNWRDRTQRARNAGSEYLNVQFGWRPLVDDAMSFGRSVVDADAVIEQYRRDIGKPIRRSYHFPTEVDQKEELLSTTAAPYVIGTSTLTGTRGRLYCKSTRTRNRWFSGCFTYYFPDNILGSRKLADLAILGEKLGLEPTPETLWNVSPWSWAADWFSNAGDVITNWSNFHQRGLVMRYGYMMETTTITSTYSLVGSTLSRVPNRPVADVTITRTVKKRLRANPYGFGVSWDGLSPFQISILGALGISRM